MDRPHGLDIVEALTGAGGWGTETTSDRRALSGRIAGKTDHMDVLGHVADIGAAGYEPGTVERGLLEQFAIGQERG